MNDLTPPGPEPERAADDDRPKGGLSVDDWLAANAGRTRQQPTPSAYRSPAGSSNAAPASRTMAGWALGLALLPCLVPLGQLVALGLAIAVLVKSRDGRDHGKGLAIAGLIISILVLLASVAYVVFLVVSYWTNGWDESERDDDGRVTEAGLVSIDRLQMGDCIEDFQTTAEVRDGEWATGEARVVPCEDPHIAEIYAINRINPDDYVDQRSLNQASARVCVRQFADYVGRDYGRSAYEVNYYNPSVHDDALLDDEVICMVTRPGGPSPTMIKDSDR